MNAGCSTPSLAEAITMRATNPAETAGMRRARDSVEGVEPGVEPGLVPSRGPDILAVTSTRRSRNRLRSQRYCGPDCPLWLYILAKQYAALSS